LARQELVEGGAWCHLVRAGDVQEFLLKPLEGAPEPGIVIFLHLLQELDWILVPAVGVINPLVMVGAE
jgi:hypothetical protein